MRWARIGVVMASRIAGVESELDQGLAHLDQLASAASINGCMRKKRTIGRWTFAKGTIAAAKAAVRRSALRSEQLVDQIGVLAQQHRQGARPDAVRVVFPEQIALAVAIDEQMGVDDFAAHLRHGRIVAETRRVERLAGDQRRTVVDPRPERRGRSAPGRSPARSSPGGR